MSEVFDILDNADLYQFTKDCRSGICPCELYGFEYCLITLVKKYNQFTSSENMNTTIKSANHLCDRIKVSDWEQVVEAIHNFTPTKSSMELKDKILSRSTINEDTVESKYIYKIKEKFEPYY